MSADQMTVAQRVDYHAARAVEAIRQAAWLGRNGDGSVGPIVDRLAYDHARDAASAARDDERNRFARFAIYGMGGER